MMRFSISIFIILALIGCDNRKCLTGHYEQSFFMMPLIIGNQTQLIPQFYNVFVCDKYEEPLEEK